MVIRIGDLCKKGHAITGDNIQEYLNRGMPHIRCKVCNTPPVPKKKLGDKCKSGHVIDGDNVIIRKNHGVESFACRECAREASRKYRNSDKFLNNPKYIKNADNAKRIRAEIEAGMRGKAGVPVSTMLRKSLDIDKKILRNPNHDSIVPALAQVDLNKRGKDALNALINKYDEAIAKCIDNPKPYIDYEDADEPSMNEAYLLCKGCPLLVECGRFANANGPEHGVWGGEVWRQGRVKKHD